jgi:transposase-like protein
VSKKRRNFSPEFKFRVVMELLTGQKRRVELLREHQLSDSTMERCVQQFRERGPEIFARERRDNGEAAQIAELERVIGRLTVELEATKKASNWLRSR